MGIMIKEIHDVKNLLWWREIPRRRRILSCRKISAAVMAAPKFTACGSFWHLRLILGRQQALIPGGTIIARIDVCGDRWFCVSDHWLAIVSHSLTHCPTWDLNDANSAQACYLDYFDANTYVGVDDWCCCPCWCCWSISCWSSFNTELLDPQCPQHVYTLNITAWNRSISIFAFSRSAAAWRDVWSGEILAKEGKQFPQGGSRGKVSRRFSVLCLRESLSRLL